MKKLQGVPKIRNNEWYHERRQRNKEKSPYNNVGGVPFLFL